MPSFSNYRPSSITASRVKSRNRAGGGTAERSLRTYLRRAGHRFRVHAKDVAGRPDLVFDSAQLCVFCDGDFWHGRRWRTLRLRLESRSNPTYWTAKIARNRQRDRAITRDLRATGWTVLRLWETDILENVEAAASVVAKQVRGEVAASPKLRHLTSTMVSDRGKRRPINRAERNLAT